jgi:hypothetical protein
LPVANIPEHFPIAFVSDDVVNYCGLDDAIVLEAFDAQWMLFEEPAPGLCPAIAIASRCTVWSACTSYAPPAYGASLARIAVDSLAAA